MEAMLHDYSLMLPLAVLGSVTIGAILAWKSYSGSKDDEDQTTEISIKQRQQRMANPRSFYRFRKREKLEYYGRKLYRRIHSISHVPPAVRAKIRRRLSLRSVTSPYISDRGGPIRTMHRPPSSLFEADPIDRADEEMPLDKSLPLETLFMLKNIRVFGHFEQPFFAELCRHVETTFLEKDQVVFQPGDIDDCIYVVESGQVALFIQDDHGRLFRMKLINAGESIISLLSILTCLTGHTGLYRTVSAVATCKTALLKLRASAFNDVFEMYPESWVRAVEMMMQRLHRVTLTTMHSYLGLSAELIHSFGTAAKGSRRRNVTTGGGGKPSTAPGGLLKETKTRHFSQDADGKDARNARFYIPRDAEKRGAIPLDRTRSTAGQSDVTEDGCLKAVKTEVCEYLALEDESLLEGRLKVSAYPPGYVLLEQGDAESFLMYVVSGSLEMLQKDICDDGRQVTAGLVHAHELEGGLAVLTGEASFYTYKTGQYSVIACISKEAFYDIIKEQPRVVLTVAHSVRVRVSRLLRAIDFALDWEMLDAGMVLYEQGAASEHVFIVLSGRLRSFTRQEDGAKELLDEYGRGDIVGILEAFSGSPRPHSVIAVRYSELARLPTGLLNYCKAKYPQVLTRVIQLLGQAVSAAAQKKQMEHQRRFQGGVNINTIALMTVNPDVPLHTFALELCHALHPITTTLHLSSDSILQKIGAHALDNVNKPRLSRWLNHQEDSFGVVVYECDFELTPWSQRCIRQADILLIVANGATSQPQPGFAPLYRQLEQLLTVRAQKKVVLLWREGEQRPTRTAEWLASSEDEVWLSGHYHVRCPNRMYVRKSPTKLAEMYAKIYANSPDKFSDMSRLARTLTGHAVGVVLGGGGAKGAAHIGTLRAMREYGIPVDLVGGTSIGSFVGGIYADCADLTLLHQRAAKWFEQMNSLWNRLWDLTYPTTSIFSGYGFNQMLKSVLSDRQIEDLWLPYFAITTDITASEMRVHTSGALWRYCRASMSLAGYLPPICDPVDGHLLLDGGYVNNLPADVMRDLGVSTVIAIDVGGQDETNLANFGDYLSGWRVLWNRWNPFGGKKKPVILSMAEVQSKLAYVSCIRQLASVKNAPFCQYIRAPIDGYGTLDFDKFDEIANVGYRHAQKVFEEWHQSGVLSSIIRTTPGSGVALGPNPNVHQPPPHSTPHPQQHDDLDRLASSTVAFTDLAAVVSKIQHPISPDLPEGSEETTTEEEEEEVELMANGVEPPELMPEDLIPGDDQVLMTPTP